MKTIIQKINKAKLFWKIIGDHISYKRITSELEFPQRIGDFYFVKKILEDRNLNNFQFAVYLDSNGKEYIAKQLPLKISGIDEYWFRNEIAIHSMFKKIFEEHGDEFNKKFPDIKVLNCATVLSDEKRLLSLTEKISSKDISAVSLDVWVDRIEKIINYFKFLNSKHNFKDEPITSRSFIFMYPIFALSVLRAIINCPEKYREILKGFIAVTQEIPFLLREKEKAFVHRDISMDNVLISESGDSYIIDFALSTCTHPMWEVVHIMTNGRRRNGFMEAFSETNTIKEIMSNQKLRRLYKALSIYCGIHLISTYNKDIERTKANKKYLDYALSI